MILEARLRGGKMIHVPSDKNSPIIYKGDAAQIAKDCVRLIDDMYAHGYNKIAADLLQERMNNRIHELLPIDDN